MGANTNVGNDYGNLRAPGAGGRGGDGDDGRGGFGPGGAGGPGGFAPNGSGAYGPGGARGNGANGGQGGFGGGCGGSGNLSQFVTTGTVISVGANSFDVRNQNGEVITVRVAPCTALNANKANYSMQVGHEAIIKAWAAASTGGSRPKAVEGNQITCLA